MQTVSTPRIYQLFARIDVSAATVTVSWMKPDARPSRVQTIEQTAEGYTELQALLLATGVAPQSTLVVLEATGSYWITLATVLAAAQFVVSVINPAQAHDFAKALLKRAKTDALDAQMLAELGARLRPESWTPPPAVYAELQQRLMQREAPSGSRRTTRTAYSAGSCFRAPTSCVVTPRHAPWSPTWRSTPSYRA